MNPKLLLIGGGLATLFYMMNKSDSTTEEIVPTPDAGTKPPPRVSAPVVSPNKPLAVRPVNTALVKNQLSLLAQKRNGITAVKPAVTARLAQGTNINTIPIELRNRV